MSAAAAQKFGELAEAFEEVRTQLKDLADHPDVLQGDRIVTALDKIDNSIKDVVKVVSDSDSEANTRHRELLNHQLAM
jgi:archaellum component FlaC